MKNKSIISIALFLLLFSQAIHAQTTEFTYQGRLVDGSLPANGTYDFQFALFTLPSGGLQISPTQTRNSITVTNGVFTVRLDFGTSFNGTDRFLEINVRQSGGGAFTPLNPRQPITSTPYAIRSLNTNIADIARDSAKFGGFETSDFTFTTDPRLTDDRNPLPGSANYIQNITSPSTVQPTSGFNVSGTGIAGFLDAQQSYRLSGLKILHSDVGENNLFLGFDSGENPQATLEPTHLLLLGNFTDIDEENFDGEAISRSTALGYNAKVTASDTIQLGEDGVTTVRIGKLGDFTSLGNPFIPLCLNPDKNEIAYCSNGFSFQENQNQLESQQKLINKQQKQIEALTALVCSQNPYAELCAKKENTDENK